MSNLCSLISFEEKLLCIWGNQLQKVCFLFLCWRFLFSFWKSCLIIMSVQVRRKNKQTKLRWFIYLNFLEKQCVCMCVSAFPLPSFSRQRETCWERHFVGGRTRSYRQISAHWNPIGKVNYIVLLKSTCDLICEPIHNTPSTHFWHYFVNRWGACVSCAFLLWEFAV